MAVHKWRGKLLACGGDAKTVKGQKLDTEKTYVTAIMYLAPHKLSGVNVCPMAEQAGCVDGCLNSAGMGRFSNVQKARIAKTAWFNLDPAGFVDALKHDIERFASWAIRKGLTPTIRLNGTSDIRWERYGVPQSFPELTFYDYTKLHNRKGLPDNYSLTWSYSEASKPYSARLGDVIKSGMNAAAVFRNRLPASFKGVPVVDGDLHDLRFLDEKGVIVGLRAKGKAVYDRSGFVIDATEKGLSTC
ncbi:MAG: GP88 family protein [Alphaproteobacteria bacterium]